MTLRRLRPAAARLGLVALTSALLAACSQISALTPVGGDAVTSVRNAVYDVLVADGVGILVAPTCASSDSGFQCEGLTLDDKAIVAVADAASPYALTITIDGETIFEGTAEDVLQRAVEEAS